MIKKLFNLIGCVLLIGLAASWIRFGYLSIYLLWLPVTYLCFSISDGSIKRLKKIKKLSRSQSFTLVISFIVSEKLLYLHLSN